ncbi:MAG: 4'-phosphopantetheinyl transferase superfamily protein [Clostridia bacterium]|nr:4'-phosphopantetheinyl transferase superfamily protein [Clostridia bacterium]
MQKSVQQLHPHGNDLQVANALQFPNFCGQAEFCAVFFAQVGGGSVNQVVCTERVLELQQIGNAHLAEQKLSAWLLLQQVLERCLSADLNSVEFCKHPSGKWTCNLCHFSISHSQNVVCVAISNNAVGVDVENLAHFSNKSPVRLLERIATQNEKSVEPTLQNVAELWSKKEAIFKAQGRGSFVPNSICTLQTPTHTFNLHLQGQQHVVSVCGSTPQFFVV